MREAENWEILAGMGRKGRIAEPERRTGGDPEPKGEHTRGQSCLCVCVHVCACVPEKGHVCVDVCGGQMVDVLYLPPQSFSETEVH